MKIEVHSASWRAVEAFIAREKQDAIDMLVADKQSEQQRGILKMLDKLQELPYEEGESSEWESI